MDMIARRSPATGWRSASKRMLGLVDAHVVAVDQVIARNDGTCCCEVAAIERLHGAMYLIQHQPAHFQHQQPQRAQLAVVAPDRVAFRALAHHGP